MNRFTGLTLVLLLCIVSVSFSQEEESNSYISKGQWMAGGKLSLSKGDDVENYTFAVSPMGGYFFGKRIAAGLRVKYEHVNFVSIDSEPMGNYQNFSATPFIRYYIGVNRFAPFAEVTYGGSWYKTESSFNGEPSVSKSNSSSYSGGVGLNYFVSKNVALEGVVKYSKTIDSYYDGSVGFDLGLQFFLSRNNSNSAGDEETYISKGQWLIGGSGNISLGTVDELDFNQFSIAPMGGYFVGKKVAVGLSTGYNYYRSSSQSFFIQPFARYYFAQNKLAPFAEVAYGGSWARFEYQGSTGETVKISGTAYRIGAGLNYFISRDVALEGHLRYSRSNDSDSGSLGLSAGLQFFIR